jgi:hypothetical protein
MNVYTVVFDHPDDFTPACMHIRIIATNYVHLMFFGTLAKEWGYEWEDMWFDKQTDLFSSRGIIMIKGKPLYYEILAGHHKPSDRVRQNATCKTTVR